jgi:CheY-like chemotaxis protein
MISMARFLVVDNNPNATAALRELLQADGHEVAAFTGAAEAVDALERSSFDVVLTDLELHDSTGRAVVRLTRVRHPTACVFVTTVRRPSQGVGEACQIFEKPLDYQSVSRMVAACRGAGGPGLHGGCYAKSTNTPLKS